MIENNNLSRFLDAQEGVYEHALQEIKNGKKTGHWMWFIFPQLRGLGFSQLSKFYAIKNKTEAKDFLYHDVLGPRLIEICEQLLALPIDQPVTIFGTVDSSKLKSSMTLFSSIADTNPVFTQVLTKFFKGDLDKQTLLLLDHIF